MKQIGTLVPIQSLKAYLVPKYETSNILIQ